jgi:thioredoxin reductase
MSEWDVVVVGRSYAGLSAALVLGRARKSVLVIGDGPPRNESVAHVHGFLTRDGASPAELIGQAERDLERYETVVLERGHVDTIEKTETGFTVRFGDRSTTAGHVVLATGVNDVPDSIPGLADLWGNGVYTCPFCDGFEHADRHWALIGEDMPAGHARVHRTWAETVTILRPDPTGTVANEVAAIGDPAVVLETTPVRRFSRDESTDGVLVELTDGRSLVVGAVFVATFPRPNTVLAEQLGCAIDPSGVVTVDAMGQTDVTGVYAAGDLTRAGAHQIAFAVADGVRVASSIVATLAHRPREAARS